MFRNIYQAMVLSRSKSAATKVANGLTKHVLKDIGYSRSDIVRTAVETVTEALDQADLKRAQAASPVQNAHRRIKNTSLRPVIVLSSVGPSLERRFLRGRND